MVTLLLVDVAGQTGPAAGCLRSGKPPHLNEPVPFADQGVNGSQ
jgi:hypothetical protein